MVLYKHISGKRRILSTDPLPLTCLTCRSDFFLSFGKPEGFSFSGTKDHVLPGHVKVPWLLSLANKSTAVLGLLCLQSIDGCYICFSSLSNEYKAFYHNNMTGYASVSSRASQASLVRYVKSITISGSRRRTKRKVDYIILGCLEWIVSSHNLITSPKLKSNKLCLSCNFLLCCKEIANERNERSMAWREQKVSTPPFYSFNLHWL